MVYRVFIAPVGFYYRRIFHHIREFNPDKIYLLTAPESTPQEKIGDAERKWRETTFKNYEKIVNDLGKIFEGKVERISVDLNYINVFKTIYGIIQKELKVGNETEIRFDITSAPTRVRVAMINLASFWKEVSVYYTPAKRQYSPEEYNPEWAEDEGEEPEPLPVTRSVPFSMIKENEFYKKIILKINEQPGKKVKPQSKLLELIGEKEGDKKRNKTKAMTLTRALNSLESFGIIIRGRTNEKEKSIELTLLGQAIAESMLL